MAARKDRSGVSPRLTRGADPVLLRNKARRLRKETGDDRYMAPLEKMDKSILNTVGHALLRPFELLSMQLYGCLDSYPLPVDPFPHKAEADSW